VTVFIVIGIVGLGLLLISLILGDLFDGLADLFDFDAGGYLSGPAIGAFLGAFGFGAALIDYNTDLGTGGSAAGGVAIGLVVGGLVGVVTKSLINMPTDPTPRAADLVGAKATVVTRIPDSGFGEVTLVQGGHFMKLAARADGSVREGTPVVVTGVLSSTSVTVSPSWDREIES
jgi:hypothetical protein